MSRFYGYLFPAIIIFGSLGTALLKQVGLLNFSFFVTWTPGPDLYGLAAIYCLVYTIALLAFRRLFGLEHGTAEAAMRRAIILPHNVATILIAVTCLYTLLYVWIDADLFTAKALVRHSGDELLRRVSLIVFLAGIFVCSTQPTFSRMIPLVLLLFGATLYPSADAGRSVAIPFLVSAATMAYNRHRLLGGLMGVVGVVALATAFETRDFPSYYNFWSTFADIVASFDPTRVLRPTLQYSFPGLDTMSVTMVYTRTHGAFDFLSNLMRFIPYYSPAPSGLFAQKFFEQISLNGILGISMDVVGLNPDIYSESLFWFGLYGVIVIPIVIAAMTCLSFWSAKTIFGGISNRSQLVGALPVIWMLVGGMVFSLRAGSRFVWAIFIAALIMQAVRVLSRPAAERVSLPGKKP